MIAPDDGGRLEHGVAEVTDPEPPGTRSVELSKELIDRMVRNFFWFCLGRPRALVVLGIGLSFGIVLALVLHSAVLVLPFLVGVPPLLGGRIYRRTKKQFVPLRVPGAGFTARFTATRMELTTPVSTSSTEYRDFMGLNVRDDTVILRYRDDGSYLVLPGDLFGPGELDRIRDQLQRR